MAPDGGPFLPSPTMAIARNGFVYVAANVLRYYEDFSGADFGPPLVVKIDPNAAGSSALTAVAGLGGADGGIPCQNVAWLAPLPLGAGTIPMLVSCSGARTYDSNFVVTSVKNTALVLLDGTDKPIGFWVPSAIPTAPPPSVGRAVPQNTSVYVADETASRLYVVDYTTNGFVERVGYVDGGTPPTICPTFIVDLTVVPAPVIAALLCAAVLGAGSDPGPLRMLGPAPHGEVRRVVTLAPSLTDVVLALGAGERLVGVSRFDERPEVSRLPRVGGFVDPSVEAVLALHPDLVLAQPGPGNRRAVETMAGLGATGAAAPAGDGGRRARRRARGGQGAGPGRGGREAGPGLESTRARIREPGPGRAPGPGAAGLRLRAPGGGRPGWLRRRAAERRRGGERGRGRGESLPGLLGRARDPAQAGADPRRRGHAGGKGSPPRAARTERGTLGPGSRPLIAPPGAGARPGARGAVPARPPGGGAVTTVALEDPAGMPSAIRFTPVRAALVLGGLFLLAAASLGLSVLLGEYPVDLGRALREPGSPDGQVLFGLRIPRALLGAMVGASLAASGSALQALLRNPLADPFVLGVSGGAALGATLALALGLQAWPDPRSSPSWAQWRRWPWCSPRDGPAAPPMPRS